MFADTALAARIDRAEAQLLAQAADAMAESHLERHALVLPIAGGLAVYVSSGSPANKVIGMGFEAPLDLASLETIEQAWRARSEAVRVELSILADPTVGPALAVRGYQLHGFENVLGRPIAAEEPAPEVPGVTVEILRLDELPVWIDIAVTGFMHLDGSGSVADDSLPRETLERALTEFATTPGWIRYLARAEGKPVGAASLALRGGLAQVAGAATLPDFRGRGVQKALLHRRLADAAASGCDFAVVTTSPGTRSQANVMRRGFNLLYTRVVMVRRWDERLGSSGS